MKYIHWIYWTLYLISLLIFSWIFIYKHLPAMGGWDGLIWKDWVSIFLMWGAGTCAWGMFYTFSLLIKNIGNA